MAAVAGSLGGVCRPGRRTRHRAAAVARRASYDRSKLEAEASATGDFFRGVQDFFNPSPPKPTEEEAEEEERRREASLASEKALRALRLGILQGEDAEGAPVRRAAPVAVLQVQAEQCLALYISTEEQTLFDVLLAMRFQKRQFEDRNILMVPILVSSDSCSLVELSPRLSGSKLLNQSYVAVPAPKNDEDREAWGKLLAREFSEAYEQGVDDEAKKEGLALMVANSGEIVGRAIGRPNWDTVFADLGL